MSKALVVKSDLAALENVLIKGDLAGFNEKQRLTYVKALCKATGVSILFQPFDYIQYQGKTVIYAKRSCTEQLRNIHKISIKIVMRERVDGCYCVTAQAKAFKGREDESIGAVNIKGLSGKELANALMVAETKAKRRVTLSICGLGVLDEIEIEQIAKAEAKVTTELAVEETTAILAQTTERPEFEKESHNPSMDHETPSKSVSTAESDYVMRAGRNKGKTLKQVPLTTLAKWWAWYNKQLEAGTQLHPDIQDDAFHIGPFLQEASGERDVERA